ncbi:unnamed protein product [Wuchereria bancrofti]|uniref:Nematode cuticle collagen N-terminal domain-containing protein n=1 Tax=Wuchereria bancrofti TaxID=6293 RepID=A0A3P7GDE8_WUCBA|nr:unnamed protein product [Wuchereria bancrofti]
MTFGKASPPEHQLRQSAFLAVVISTVVVITSIITLPMLYSFITTFQSHLFREIEYCKARTKDINKEFSLLSNEASDISNDRIRRQHSNYEINSNGPSASSYLDQYPQLPLNANHKLSSRSFCSCQQGPVGQPGTPGDNGPPGVDAMSGADVGDMGKIGPKGAYGKPGNLIKVGTSQGCGFEGRSGPSGGYGRRGKPGRSGKSSDGPIGPRGTPGLGGKPGTSGTIGPPGARGRIGESGDCRHCPKPPGY